MNREKRDRVLAYIFIAIVPLLCVLLYLTRFMVPFQSLSIYNSLWNDELSYYKQIEGMVLYCLPKGFFGYNESKALVGTLGPWSPALLLPYALIFKVLGISTYKIIFTNIVLCSVTLLGCSILFELKWKEIIPLAILFFSYANFARYILSISPEIIIMLSTILMFSFLFKYELDSNDGFFVAFLIILTYLTLSRGYYAIYGLAGLVLARDSKKRITVVITVIVSALAYLVMVHFLCSPYFTPLINMDLVRMIWTSPISFITSSYEIVGLSVKEAYAYIVDLKIEGSFVGVFYLLAFIMIIVSIICCIVGKSKTVLSLCMSFILMIISIWLLYDVRSGSRHFIAGILAITFLDYIVIAKKQGIQRIVVMAIMAIMVYTTYFREDDFSIIPPKAEIELSYEIDNAELELEFGKDGWDNTVIWSLGCDYRYLYALPAGTGINLCTDDYVIENANRLKSKYIAVNSSSEAMMDAARLNNWNLLQQIGTVAIYSVR